MKHFLILALAAVLILTLLTGCRNRNNNAEETLEDAATTISEGLGDITGNNTTTNNNNTTTNNSTTEQTSEATEEGSSAGETNARSRRGISRY